MASKILLFHSLLRYLVVILMLISIVKAISGLRSDGKVKSNDIEFITLFAFHLQVLVGVFLYIVSPTIQSALADMEHVMSNPEMRFKVIEHPITMLIAAIVITIGFSQSKKFTDVKAFSKRVLIYYGIALLIILSRIPVKSWFFIS